MNETFMCAYETDSLHMHAEVKVRVSEPESLFPVQLILTSEDILELNQRRDGNQNPVVTLSSESDKKKLDWNLIPVNVLIFCSGFDGSVADKLLVLSQTNTRLRINQNADIRTAANTPREEENTRIDANHYCQARVRSSKVQSPKVKTKRTWADTKITWATHPTTPPPHPPTFKHEGVLW